MATISSMPFGIKVCEVLGIDPKKTGDIIISIPTNDVILVTINQYLQDTEADKLISVLKEYDLVPKKKRLKEKE